jgi:NAD(P)H-flavin reductase
MGTAELRQPPLDLPSFYRPDPAASDGIDRPRPTPEPDERGDRKLVRELWDEMSDRADKLIRMFYAELFAILGGEALTMFPSDMTVQRDDFGRLLVQWVLTEEPETLGENLRQLGADHRKFAVEARHYELAGQALINAFRGVAGASWTPRVESAVVSSYNRLASTMIDGAIAASTEPSSWDATVIAHERVLPDFAVLRIQPDAPYPYKAGQYLTVEASTHRLQWRQMSIASAPRANNTFDVHVRSVGASGVSAALVAHTKVGDRLRLGPPRGNDLVVEPGTVPGGLLCVCSGTGAAPISAVVESMVAWKETPPLYAFVGGQTARDLYPVNLLNHLVRTSGRDDQVRVYGVVADDPDYVGYRGRVEALVPSLLDWAELGVDVLIAGPNRMISSTVAGLTDHGVPLERIHFDQYENAA